MVTLALILALASLAALGAVPVTPKLGMSGAAPSSAAAPVVTYPLPKPGAYPLGITTDPSGNIWFAEDNTDMIAEFTPSNGAFRTYSIPTPPHLAWIWSIVFAGGNLWFADDSQSLLWEFSPQTHTFSNFTAQGAFPFSLAYDQSTGRMWFTSLTTEQVGYFMISGQSAEFGRMATLSAPSPGAGPSDLVLDGSGNPYVSETFQAKIVEVNASSLQVARTWALPAGSEPVGLAFDASEGRLWFTNHATSYFGYVNLSPGGGYMEFSTSLLLLNGTYWVTLPYWIKLGPGGSVWFDEHGGNKIARFDPQTMQLTEFPIPTNESSPLSLVVDDASGAVWFTEFSGNALGSIAGNSSTSQEVTVSTASAVVNPSASFEASGPAPEAVPTVSFTGTMTGEPAPAFSADVSQSGQGYLVSVGEETASPGNYTAAVCYRYAYTNQCGYAVLTVPVPPSAAPLLDAIYITLAAIVVGLVYAVRREFISAKKRAAS